MGRPAAPGGITLVVLAALGAMRCVEGANLVYKAGTVQSTHDLSARGGISAGGDCKCGGDSVNELASWFIPPNAMLNVELGTTGVGVPNGAPFGGIQEAWDYLSQRVMRGPVTISVTNCDPGIIHTDSVYLRGRLTHPIRLLFEERCELPFNYGGPALLIDGPSIVLSSNLTISKVGTGQGSAGVVVKGSGSSLSLVSPERTQWFEPLGTSEGGLVPQDMHENVVLSIKYPTYKMGLVVTGMGRLNTFDGLIRCASGSLASGEACVMVRSNSVGEYLRVESLPGVILRSALGSVAHIHQIEESMAGREVSAETGSIITNVGSPASQFDTVTAASNAYVYLKGATLVEAHGINTGFLELDGGSIERLLKVDTGSTMVGSPSVNGAIVADHASLLLFKAAYIGTGITAKAGSKVVFHENVAITDDPTDTALMLESSHALFLKDFQATGHTTPIFGVSSTVTTMGTWTTTMVATAAGTTAVEFHDTSFATAGVVSISGHLGTGLNLLHSSVSSKSSITISTPPTVTAAAISMEAGSSLLSTELTVDGGRGLYLVGGEVTTLSLNVVNTETALLVESGLLWFDTGVISGRVQLILNAILSTESTMSITSPNSDCLHLETGSVAGILGEMTCRTGMRGVVAESGSSIKLKTATMDTGNTCIEASGGASVELRGPFGCDRATNMPQSTPLLRAEGGAVVRGGAGTFANFTGSVGSGDCLAASSNAVVDLDSVHCENYHRLASADFGASVTVNSLDLITPPWSSTDCVRQWHTGTVAAKLEGPNAPLCEGLGASSWCASGSNVSFVASPTEPTTSAYSFLHSC